MTNSRVYIDVLPENGNWRLEAKNISEHELNVDPSELTERFKRGDSAIIPQKCCCEQSLD